MDTDHDKLDIESKLKRRKLEYIFEKEVMKGTFYISSHLDILNFVDI